ncbi:MAG: hypothetical protein KAT00_00215 [Planctomycetes bacterium]|nr:hypothetical protein [Planctomycetota bacterium]
MSRYFKIVDETIIEGVLAHMKHVKSRRAVAIQWAKDRGFCDGVLFYRDGMFGTRVGGLTHDRNTPVALREKCTKPKRPNYEIRPKKTADKDLWASYAAMCAEVFVAGSETDELIGFGEMTFFPFSPGFHFSTVDLTGFWTMQDRVTEVKGCVEVTNIEYLEATKDDK